MTASAVEPAVIEELAGVVGPAHVLSDPEVTAGYTLDWTRRFAGSTPLVIRPGDTAETAAVLGVLAAARIPVVPQGGNTGLVGGSVPLAGEAVLSTRRLRSCEPVDELASQVTLGAGVTLAEAQAHAAGAGLSVGVDLAARDSATIGGMVATNAGGINVVRYGSMRAQVAGIEAVLADGSVVSHMAGLEKDNTGYDLEGLLAGSEGTLGIITRVRLRLHPVLSERATALLAFDTAADAVVAAAALRRTVASLRALEAVFCDAMTLVSQHLGVNPPVGTVSTGSASDGGLNALTPRTPGADGGAAWLVVEAAARADPSDELATAVADLGDLVTDAAVALDPGARQRLWAFREHVTEAISAAGIPHKLDVTLPAARLAEFTDGVTAVVRAADPHALPLLFGHLGDGNVHVNVLGPDGAEPAAGVDDAVLRYVADLGGSISAEHGIGTAKLAQLHLNRSEAELAAFAAIKRALDPAGLLNPNVLLP
ncbi:FAD-binding oxidoreductase [Candidatus Poriferisodalis sp.]|uniref:FAD-binding oxidoreductase n=1 Tax=Candidatus Poriferisodalis sp. TaxID=3101277 RepID=UPI003B023F44